MSTHIFMMNPYFFEKKKTKKYSLVQINHTRELQKTNIYANVEVMMFISRSTLKRTNK